MFEKIVTAIEPFALTLVILCGASLAGWISFSNTYPVGLLLVFIGIMLVVKHIVLQIKSPKKKG